MTLLEAIEVLKKDRNDHHSFSTDTVGQAEHLAIVALNMELFIRNQHPKLHHTLLPGETED